MYNGVFQCENNLKIGTTQHASRHNVNWSQAVLAETVETGDKIGGVTKAIHRKLSQEILMQQDFSTCGGWRGY